APVQAQQYIISTYAGGASVPLAPVPASSVSIAPAAVAVDSVGDVYFVAANLNSILKVDRGGLLTRVAGGSTPGFAGDGGPAVAARLRLAGTQGVDAGIAVDSAGSLFFADSGNNRIRKIAPDGVIVTVAGNGAADFSGDGGPAVDASLQDPSGLA